MSSQAQVAQQQKQEEKEDEKEEAKEELKELEKEKVILEKNLDDVLEIGETTDNDAEAAEQNDIADNIEDDLAELEKEIAEKKIEADVRVGSNIYNKYEIDMIYQTIKRLLPSHQPKLSPNDIGVITPYTKQVKEISEKLSKNKISKGVEVRTVDGFQGREKEIILISLARSNNDNEIGCLINQQQIHSTKKRQYRKN
ncbi:hypothetical protein I4U23_010657 [Adineta vaga]|nr:hypothetical protein I4U23_010657 [Adineta vaga]